MWAGRSSSLAALALTLLACNEPLAPPGGKPKTVPRDAAAVAPVVHEPVVPPADAAPAIDAAAAVDAAPPPAPFYTVTDALADVKASPLKRIGIGAWPGNFSIKGCVYKNDRVFVVDVYCTYKEQPAFSVVVISPSKGEVRIYAEADDPISTIERSDYFTFYAETYPPLADHPVPALKDATFEQVTDWQQKINEARLVLPALGACSTDIPTCPDDSWLAPTKDFIKEPTESWKWIIDQLRTRSTHDGKYVKK